MARKRTASYKRARRRKNRNKIAQLLAKPRDPNRTIPAFRVVFQQRRNQVVFEFQGDGKLREHTKDQSTPRESDVLYEDSE